MDVREAMQVLRSRPRVWAADRMTIERAEGESPRLRGHAAVFDEWTELWPGVRERVAPGAFTQTLADGADVRALWNHDSNIVLGRTRSETLALAEDPKGLAIDLSLPDTQTVRDLVVVPIERGDVSGMSFAFRIRAEDKVVDDSGDVSYTLTDLDLDGGDISPVTYPAYPQTDVAMRAAEAIRSASERERRDALESLEMRGRLLLIRMRMAERAASW